MPHRRTATRCLVAAATSLGLAVGGCGQLTMGDTSSSTTQSGASGSDSPESFSAPVTSASVTSAAPAPSPGPDATPGCERLVEPVYRLVTGGGDTEAESAQVRRLANGVQDNALSAVASRISGLATQPVVDPAALDNQWEQFSQLCDLG